MYSTEVILAPDYFEDWRISLGNAIVERLQDNSSSFNDQQNKGFNSLNDLSCEWIVTDDGELVCYWVLADQL